MPSPRTILLSYEDNNYYKKYAHKRRNIIIIIVAVESEHAVLIAGVFFRITKRLSTCLPKYPREPRREYKLFKTDVFVENQLVTVVLKTPLSTRAFSRSWGFSRGFFFRKLYGKRDRTSTRAYRSTNAPANGHDRRAVDDRRRRRRDGRAAYGTAPSPNGFGPHDRFSDVLNAHAGVCVCVYSAFWRRRTRTDVYTVHGNPTDELLPAPLVLHAGRTVLGGCRAR